MQDKTNKRMLIDKIFVGGIVLFSIISLMPLIFILLYLIKNGISVINWQFLTNLPAASIGAEGGGIANALVGSMMLVVIASILAVPVGIAAGVYLSENKKGNLANTVKACIEILMGTPSIVVGIVAYLWIVKPLKSFSALSGGFALALMMLPVIIRTTEETLKMIPDSLKEASLALGVPYPITIMRVIIPSGLSGILTGILISVSRILGETAPLLFTAFGNPFMNVNVLKPVNSLPLLIYNFVTSPYQEWHRIAYGASFVLLVIVFSLNILTKMVIKKWRVQF